MQRAWHEATAALNLFMAGPPRRDIDVVARALGTRPVTLSCWLNGGRPHGRFHRRIEELTAGAIVPSVWATELQRLEAAVTPSAELVQAAQAARLLRRRIVRHGMSYTREYTTWVGIQNRCYDPKTVGYEDYGGRGIRVCDGWRRSFLAFLADMGKRPGRGYSIEREKNDRGYSCGKCDDCIARGEPKNCRWATAGEQNRNQRRNLLVTHNGRTMCVAEWARETGASVTAIRGRLLRGISGADLFMTEVPFEPLSRKASAALMVARGERVHNFTRPTCCLGAQLLFDCMIQRRLRRKEVARTLGVSVNGVQSWLRRGSKPLPEARARIAAWSDGTVPQSSWDEPAQEAA